MKRSTPFKRAAITGVAMCAAGLIAVGSAVAASSGGSEGTGSEEVNCNEGWVYDEKKRVCVREEAASPQDIYNQGRALAAAGEYDRAVRLFQAMGDQDDAMVLTMIGYSKRKMGAVDDGIAYYHKALAIEPDNVLTREYLGEGYVTMGRYDLAEAELDRIGAICGVDCKEYQDLAAAIAGEPGW